MLYTQGIEPPLIVATHMENKHAIDLLLKHRADPNQRGMVRSLFSHSLCVEVCVRGHSWNFFLFQNDVAAFEVAEMEMRNIKELMHELNPQQVLIYI